MFTMGRYLFKVVVMAFISIFLTELSVAQNQIWIVNNNPGGAGDFNDAEEAYSNVSAGDTLYLVPSQSTYTIDRIEKQLHFVGSGYLLDENDTSVFDASESELRLERLSGEDNGATADGTSFFGLIIIGTAGTLDIRADEISFRRCFIMDRVKGNNSHAFSGLTVVQSYLEEGLDGHFTDVYISNSYIGGAGYPFQDVNNGLVVNSIIEAILGNLENLNIENNIIFDNDASHLFDASENNTITNSIFVHEEPSSPGTNNQFNVDPSTLFVGPDGNSTDAQWQLSESSPAKGAGTNGDDIGMFGGPNPYVLSGIPAIPRVTEFTAPSAGSGNSGLPVSITIQSEN